VSRWLLGSALQQRFGAASLLAGAVPFPIGTLIVNVSGSFVMGALAVVIARQTGDTTASRLLLMVGFCGGYTTFSTFSLDTVSLIERGSPGLAALNLLGSVALALLAAVAGIMLARVLLGRIA
jgi:CrcB protein